MATPQEKIRLAKKVHGRVWKIGPTWAGEVWDNSGQILMIRSTTWNGVVPQIHYVAAVHALDVARICPCPPCATRVYHDLYDGYCSEHGPAGA